MLRTDASGGPENDEYLNGKYRRGSYGVAAICSGHPQWFHDPVSNDDL
jgi:hypothetical protein